jgi:uncharacterized membrane protein
MILELSPEASPVAQFAAATILYLHIGAGLIALLSGAASAIVKKGSGVHRRAGDVFVVSMLVMAAIGAGVSPFLQPAQWANVIAGFFTLYLVTSGYLAGARSGDASWMQWTMFIVAVVIAVCALSFAITVEKASDAGPAYLFGTIVALAAVGDLRLILRRSSNATQRLARHLWRMTFAFAIATASLFLGQPQLFPKSLRGALFVPVLAVLAFMLFWIVRMRFVKRLPAMSR